jgi:hypothetical protein
MAIKNLLGLSLSARLADLAGGVLGKRRALANLGFPAYIFSVLKSIAHWDILNNEGTFQNLSNRDMYGLRNLKSSLQAQIDSFFARIKTLETILSKIFPNTVMRSTVGYIEPVTGLTDLATASKTKITYNSLGNKIGTSEEFISFIPTSLTTCKLNLGPTNGDNTTSSAVNSQGKPLYENRAEEFIGDFDSVTIEWEEQQVAGSPPVKKRRENMQVNGPFYSTQDFQFEFKQTEKGGLFVWELDLVRGTGDSFQWLLENGATATFCKILKKVNRKFKCHTEHFIRKDQIASIQRTQNVTTVVLKDNVDWLGKASLAADNPADDRIVKNQPIVVRATGPLADFGGAYTIFSVDRRLRTLTYLNVSSSQPSTLKIDSPDLEMNVLPFYSEKFRQGESVNMTVINPNTKVSTIYRDLIVGEDQDDFYGKGFYLYGKSDVNYELDRDFEKARSWGHRQAAIINNFPNSKLQASARSFTARQFIRGYASASMPSVQHGNIFGTSVNSLWNRISRKQDGVVMGISFPGEVQINGSLEVQRTIGFGTSSALVKNPVLGAGSVVSPFYEYFNKEKELTHFFRIKIGSLSCFLPANTFEEQVFKHNREVESRGSSLSETAIVALDKFYTAGNKFTFAAGGTMKSFANQANIFFGDLFQPLLRITSPITNDTYRGIYANVMPVKPGFEALRTIPATTQETDNIDLNKYYATLAGPSMEFSSFADESLSPAKTFSYAINAFIPKQTSIFDPAEDSKIVVPTNKNTIVLVFRIRPDWADARPDNGSVEDENTPQVIMSQGVDFELLRTRPAGQTQDIFYRDNGLGWFLYTNNYTSEDRTIYFTNPGPWTNQVGVSSFSGGVSEPTRVSGFDANVALTKKFKVNKWHFLAMTFKTTESDIANSPIMSDTDMGIKQTMAISPVFYPNAASGFSPTQNFIDQMRPTQVSFFAGQSTDALVTATPGQNSLKIIRTGIKQGTISTRYNRAFGVGLPAYRAQYFSEKNGYGNVNQATGSSSRYSHIKYRVCCPMDVAFLAQIGDIISNTDILNMYKSLRTGTFKNFAWGDPV